jgi:hypothetical protein
VTWPKTAIPAKAGIHGSTISMFDDGYRPSPVWRNEMNDRATRTRLAEIEGELARLRYRHDIAMSAFRFEEATALGPAIATLERERQALETALPAAAEPPTGIVPLLTRPPRRQRSRK